MPSKTFTVSTRLSKDSELVRYAEQSITEYSKIYRYAWHFYINNQNIKRSDLRNHLVHKFGILSRTANSIAFDIDGRLKSYIELKKTELNQLEIKILKKEEKVTNLIVTINSLKPVVANNTVSSRQLQKYKSAKQSLYYQKNKLNKMRQSKANYEYEITNNIYKLGFGSKHNFDNQYRLEENGFKSHQGWYNDYVKQRDKNIFYLGSNNETQGNQLFQMCYNQDTDDFTIKVRKDFGFDKNAKYLIDTVDFKYQNDLLKQICLAYQNKTSSTALSYRIHRMNNKWYLQVLFTIEYENYETTNQFGTIGLDYNDGFIELSETDEKGNLVNQKHYDLTYHGTGNKAKTEIEQTISNIVNYAKSKGKDISIENLNFKCTKAHQSKAKGKLGKKYNSMLHKFDYRRYKDTLDNCCHRRKVNLIKVNPRNTSKIGKQKYSDRMKLSVHQAASFVIARKGQGFVDKLVS